ncbi:MAG TPA: hypothetical protein VGM96_03145 [Reyranella sp.]
MARLSLYFAGAAALVCAMTLGACARPVGDFGRSAPDPLHDTVMPIVGKARAFNQKEPVSAFNLTDEEQEMRDRVWRYLVSPHAYDWFGDTIAELQRTRIVPVSNKPLPTDRYYGWLHGERFASSHVRYSRASDDVTADIEMMPDVFRSICVVERIDRQRGIASNEIQGLEAKVSSNAAARYAENHMVIDWFVRAVRNRYDSYGYALDHLLVETPHEEAVKLNGLLSGLATYVSEAESGDFCAGMPGGRDGGNLPIRSRALLSDRPVKGS